MDEEVYKAPSQDEILDEIGRDRFASDIVSMNAKVSIRVIQMNPNISQPYYFSGGSQDLVYLVSGMFKINSNLGEFVFDKQNPNNFDNRDIGRGQVLITSANVKTTFVLVQIFSHRRLSPDLQDFYVSNILDNININIFNNVDYLNGQNFNSRNVYDFYVTITDYVLPENMSITMDKNAYLRLYQGGIYIDDEYIERRRLYYPKRTKLWPTMVIHAMTRSYIAILTVDRIIDFRNDELSGVDMDPELAFRGTSITPKRSNNFNDTGGRRRRME